MTSITCTLLQRRSSCDLFFIVVPDSAFTYRNDVSVRQQPKASLPCWAKDPLNEESRRARSRNFPLLTFLPSDSTIDASLEVPTLVTCVSLPALSSPCSDCGVGGNTDRDSRILRNEPTRPDNISGFGLSSKSPTTRRIFVTSENSFSALTSRRWRAPRTNFSSIEAAIYWGKWEGNCVSWKMSELPPKSTLSVGAPSLSTDTLKDSML